MANNSFPLDSILKAPPVRFHEVFTKGVWFGVARSHDEIRWVHEGLGFCYYESDFEDTEGKCYWFEQPAGPQKILIAIPERYDYSDIEVQALLVHEINHAFDYYLEAIGVKPGEVAGEFTSHALQVLYLWAIQEYER